MTQVLEFAVGPVQRFVAESRRTRDLWGSSYLLSFLTAHALVAGERYGRVLSPYVEENPLYRLVTGTAASGSEPLRYGALPNTFRIEVSEDPAVAADAARKAFQSAWQRVCAAVWEEFVAGAESQGQGTERIWRRQVDSFWDLSWTVCETADDSAMWRRKLWRTHALPEEPGDKCTVMPSLQELSGFVRAEGLDRRRGQDAFWAAVRELAGGLDIRQNERLSAIALVKRLYAKVSEEALGFPLDTTHWPSTVRVAALPWIRAALERAPAEAGAYGALVAEVAPEALRESVQLRGVRLERDTQAFLRLDANFLHLTWIENPKQAPLANEEDRGRLHAALQTLQNQREAKLGHPPTFYALLLADGDRLGELIRSRGSSGIGPALSRFTERVMNDIEQVDGVVVYAGGDDVLAMTPAVDALSAARTLARDYREAVGGSLSAAVVFASIRLPLGLVLRTARELLDNGAKEENGRDSLGVMVLKRGGVHSRWLTRWVRRRADGTADDAVQELQALVAEIRRDGEGSGLSSSFLFRLRDTLSIVCGGGSWHPGSWHEVPTGLDLKAFVQAELDHGLANDEWQSQFERWSDQVVRLLYRSRAGESVGQGPIGFDGLLLARFLASRTEEDE